MFERIGRLASTFPKTICLAWLVVGGLLAVVAPHWDTRTHDDDVRFVPERFTSVRAHLILEKAFPKDIAASKAVFVIERQNGPLSDSDLQLADLIVRDVEKLREESPELKVGKVEYYKEGLCGPRLTSADRQCTLICVALESPYLALATMNAVNRLEEVVRARFETEDKDPGLTLFATGSAGIGRDLTAVASTSLHDTTLATVILVIVVLILVYRAPLLAMIPLATIAVSVWVALNMLALMTNIPGVYLVNISKIFCIVILYGAGTDYCLFLVSRYREELEEGHKTREAITRSVKGVGEALAASAGTVMVGLALMATAEFAKVRYAGPAIAISLGVALVASLTLTPALLRLLGKRVFWPQRGPVSSAKRTWKSRLGFWDWISHKVAKRPGWVWAISVAAILPLMFIGMRVKSDHRATGELSPESSSLKGLAALQRHFTAGEIGPVTVLLVTDEDWTTPRGDLEVRRLSTAFAALPNVAEVRSQSQPMGVGLPELLPPEPEDVTLRGQLWTAIHPYLQEFCAFVTDQGRPYFTGTMPGEDGGVRYVTRLDIVLNSDPFEPESLETLRLIEHCLKSNSGHRFVEGAVQAEVFGITANMRDLAQVTESDRSRINLLVVGAIFLILFVLVRRPVLALYLLVTVLASYYAALGATILAGTLWTGAPLTSVDWRVPFFLFTILVAVGEDYNILLISRALEERKQYGGAEGMRRALSKTGGAITSCGLIMAGTFATLMLAGINTMMQVGFALAFGVLIDTFLVRPFLVPAFCMLFWKDGAVETRTVQTKEEEETPNEILRMQAAEIAKIVQDLKRAA